MKRLMTVVSLVALSSTAAGGVEAKAPHAVTPARIVASPHVAKRVHARKGESAKPVVPHVVFLKFKVAPADEYFGRLKLSILGIRNTIKDMGYKVDADPEHKMALNAIALTEDAMHDWERKYPKDSWIPPAILSLERLYAKVDSDEARAHAKYAMVWLVKDYPATAPGKLGKKELAANIVGVKPAPASDANAAVAGGASNEGRVQGVR
jgi:hypothetical protein